MGIGFLENAGQTCGLAYDNRIGFSRSGIVHWDQDGGCRREPG